MCGKALLDTGLMLPLACAKLRMGGDAMQHNLGSQR
jgi:hypothetical protein